MGGSGARSLAWRAEIEKLRFLLLCPDLLDDRGKLRKVGRLLAADFMITVCHALSPAFSKFQRSKAGLWSADRLATRQLWRQARALLTALAHTDALLSVRSGSGRHLDIRLVNFAFVTQVVLSGARILSVCIKKSYSFLGSAESPLPLVLELVQERDQVGHGLPLRGLRLLK